MNNEIKKEVLRIKSDYEKGEMKESKLEELKRLDGKVKNPVLIFVYTLGIIGTLILGTGMCLAMKVIGGSTALMIVGIMIGVIGIAICLVNYFIYKKLLEKRKEKYSAEILKISNELLKEE